MGREPGGAAVRRHGLHDRIRGRTPVSRHAHPRNRRRNNRNPHRACGQDAWIPVMTWRSPLAPASPAYVEAASVMTEKLAELNTEHAKALAGGGPKKIQTHPKPGKPHHPDSN